MLTPLRTRLHHLTLWWHQHHPAATTWNTFYIQELFVVLLALGTGIYSAPEFSMDYIAPPLTFSLLAPHLLLATLAFLLTIAPRHPLLIRLLNAALFLHPIGEYLAIPVMLVTLWYGFFVPRPTSCPKTRNPAVYFAYHPVLFLIFLYYFYSAIYTSLLVVQDLMSGDSVPSHSLFLLPLIVFSSMLLLSLFNRNFKVFFTMLFFLPAHFFISLIAMLLLLLFPASMGGMILMMLFGYITTIAFPIY